MHFRQMVQAGHSKDPEAGIQGAMREGKRERVPEVLQLSQLGKPGKEWTKTDDCPYAPITFQLSETSGCFAETAALATSFPGM